MELFFLPDKGLCQDLAKGTIWAELFVFPAYFHTYAIMDMT